MGRKSKLSVDQKVEAVEDVLIRHYSKNYVCKKFGLSKSNELSYMIELYKAYGIDGLKPSHKNRKYTHEDKIAVLSFLKTGQSYDAASRKFLINPSVIKQWLKCYTNPIKGGFGMANKGGKDVKKQYFDIKIMEKAVEECIASKYDYNGVASRYGIKYSALYSWVRKYEKNGIDGLKRKTTGRKKADTPELTEADKLRIENLKKDQRIRELEETIEILKKKEEISLKLVTGQIKYNS